LAVHSKQELLETGDRRPESGERGIGKAEAERKDKRQIKAN
jgi:hypothetical protein